MFGATRCERYAYANKKFPPPATQEISNLDRPLVHYLVLHPLNPQPRRWRSGIHHRLKPVNRPSKSRVGSNPREALFVKSVIDEHPKNRRLGIAIDENLSEIVSPITDFE